MAKWNRRVPALLAVVCAALAVAMVADEHLEQKNERYQQHLAAARPTGLAAAPWDGTVPTLETLHTHLPIVTLDTGGAPIPGLEREGQYVHTDFTVHDSETGDNTAMDPPVVDQRALIRYRGNSSLHFEKHQYLIEVIDGNGDEKDVPILGMEPHHKWVLNGPFLDKTLLRNYMWMNLSAQVMGYAPEVRFCEVFVNGEYQGVYVMMQKVTYGEGRVQLTAADDRRPDGKTSYLVRLDRGDSQDLLFDDLLYLGRISPGVRMNAVYPSRNNITPAQQQYITQELVRLEKTLYSYDYDEPAYIDAEFDIGSFVDYLILNELSANLDAGGYSTYFYRDIRGKFTIGPVWDFNNCLDNYVETDVDETGFFMLEKSFYYMLTKDERFTERVIRRYRQLRKSVLSEEALTAYIDDVVAYLGPAVERNFCVWGDSFENDRHMLQPKDRNLRSYDAALEQMRTYLMDRGRWLDENIELLWQYSHESKVKQYQH